MNDFDLKSEDMDIIDYIICYMEAGITPYIHGLSGDGKSRRVKDVDPDLEVIRVANATPERICGKSIYIPPRNKIIEIHDGDKIEVKVIEIEPGHMEDIKPAWLVRLEEKCQREPNKLHIIFFDELSNALPTISNFIYNIILNSEVNGKWKLPSNARIVAAGNEMKDSLAANEIPRPLFSRMAHLYVNTNIDNWKVWASKNNIHPAIIAFNCLYNGKYLRTPYTGLRPNTEPRKWEMVSKVLINGKSIDPLYTLIDKNIVEDFKKFLFQRMISLEDIINNDFYDDIIQELPRMTPSELYLLIAVLSDASEDDLENVYSIIEKMSEEYIKLFHIMWIKGNVERLNIINNIHKNGKRLVR